jgi:hypothetical protein
MTTTYATNPTLTINQIGYSIQATTTSIDAPTANVIYNVRTITFPSLGVWMVQAHIFPNTTFQGHYALSISTSTTAHDFRNRVTSYANVNSLTDRVAMLTMIVDSYTPTSPLYILASATVNQATSGVFPYQFTYQVSFTITKLG